MHTTLAIDDDVLAAAKGLASLHRKSVGEVISALARQALQPQTPSPATRNGVPLLQPHTGTMPATLEMVNKLRDELPDELKRRATTAAQELGISPQAFMISAIRQAADAVEQRSQFVEQAQTARAEMLRSGLGYDANEVRSYLRQRLTTP